MYQGESTEEEARTCLLATQGQVKKEYVDKIDKLCERLNVQVKRKPGLDGSSGGSYTAAPRFVKAAKTALRVAFWSFLTGVGVWLLRHYDALPPIYVSYLNGIVIAIIFNVTTNVASTIQSVIQSFVGTGFAILVSLMLYHLPDPHNPDLLSSTPVLPTCPAGDKINQDISDELYNYFCIASTGLITADKDGSGLPGVVTFMAFVVFSFFVAVTLALNVVMPFKTFALVGALNFMMTFANPGIDTEHYMALSLTSPLGVTVVTQAAGSAIAILAMLLPPVTATASGQAYAARATKCMAELLLYVTQYYAGSDKTLKINVYNSQLARNREDMAQVSKDLDQAWWEFFDWGKTGVSRLLLSDHLKMLKDLDRRLSVMQTAVLREGFEASHKNVMQRMRAPMLKVVKTTSDCLLAATLAAADGRIQPGEEDLLHQLRKDVDASVEEMAAIWRTERGDLANAMSEEMRSESFFLVELSAFARKVGEFADELDDPPKPTNLALNAIKSIVSREKLAKPEFRNFVLRNWISLMIAWWWAAIANSYATSVPMNVVFMLTEQPGNSLLMNLQKLQASVLGSLAGTVLYRAFHYCSNVTRFLKLTCLFCWELVAMFIANYTSEYANVGLLLAVYGGGKLMALCDERTTNGEVMHLNSEEFRALRFFAYAMCIVSFVDFAMRPKAACDQARDKLIKAVDKSLDYFRDYLNGNTVVGFEDIHKETADVTDEVSGYLDDAEAMLAAADQEPRFQKGPFKSALFTDLCQRTRRLTLQMQVLIRRSQGGSSGLLDELKQCPSWQHVKDDIEKTIKDCEMVVKKVITYDDFGAMDPNSFNELLGKKGVDQVDDLKKLEKEVRKLDLKLTAEGQQSLEYGKVARFAALFELLELYVQDLAGMISAAVSGM